MSKYTSLVGEGESALSLISLAKICQSIRGDRSDTRNAKAFQNLSRSEGPRVTGVPGFLIFIRNAFAIVCRRPLID
jgi:hypothetical protein